jgi:two-component system, response regulator PdtaR
MNDGSDDVMSRRRVLVVEDEVLLAMEIEDVLVEAGFDVVGPASSVARALQLVSDRRPDAAVLDVTLVGEKVTPVALLLKSLDIPFVLASASDTAELARHQDLAEAFNLGKPTDPHKLIDTLVGLCPPDA